MFLTCKMLKRNNPMEMLPVLLLDVLIIKSYQMLQRPFESFLEIKIRIKNLCVSYKDNLCILQSNRQKLLHTVSAAMEVPFFTHEQPNMCMNRLL